MIYLWLIFICTAALVVERLWVPADSGFWVALIGLVVVAVGLWDQRR